MAKKTAPQVTDAEFAVLDFLWENGPSKKRDIVQALYPECRDADHATVQKLLERLEAKRLVRRDRSRFAHTIRATVSREKFAGQQLRAAAEKLTGGSLVPLLIQLVQREKLSDRDREEIRRLLDDAS